MAQLQSTDKFIVDRGGSTYKTTFEDIEKSLNLEHDFTAVVDATVGGSIETYEIDPKGQDFLVDRVYTAIGPQGEVTFETVSVDSVGGIESITIIDNDAIDDGLDKTYTVNPFRFDGSLYTVTVPAIPGLTDGTSAVFNIRQTLDLGGVDDDGNSVDTLIAAGRIRVTNNAGSYDTVVVDRGAYYDEGVDAFLEDVDINGDTSDGLPVTITTVDIDDGEPHVAVLTVLSVADGADSDKAKLTVKIGDTEKDIFLVPGDGIVFEDLSNNEIKIVNTITQLDGGDVSNGANVIVNESAPTENIFDIRDGTLWYNLLDGRLYVAVTYTSNGSTTFDWIDASPSSFNDALRKNQNDSTNYKIDVNNSLYASHFDLERLPLIS